MGLAQKFCIATLTVTTLAFVFSTAQRVITKPTDHAKVARQLVHEADWAAVGSMTTDPKILGYPMVNVLSIADSAKGGASTGNITFLLTDTDSFDQDWSQEKKVTFLFSKEQGGGCSRNSIDPMEPTCARAFISGTVVKIDPNSLGYQVALDEFISRHPSATNWLKVHDFYLRKLDIKNIYVLDWYGGPQEVSVEDYYKINL